MNLQHRQDIIKIKRKATSWRDFVMECASWQQFNFYKTSQGISRYPETNRIGNLVNGNTFFEENE